MDVLKQSQLTSEWPRRNCKPWSPGSALRSLWRAHSACRVAERHFVSAYTPSLHERTQTRSARSEYLRGRRGESGARVKNERGHAESLDHLGATGEELGLVCHLAVSHTTGERPHVLGVASWRYVRFQPESSSYP